MQLLFRSVNKLLMDTATSEYLFCSDFFQEAAVFHELFAPTLQVVESALAATLPVSMSYIAPCSPVPFCPELFVLVLQAVVICFWPCRSYATTCAVLFDKLCCHAQQIMLLYPIKLLFCHWKRLPVVDHAMAVVDYAAAVVDFTMAVVDLCHGSSRLCHGSGRLCNGSKPAIQYMIKQCAVLCCAVELVWDVLPCSLGAY